MKKKILACSAVIFAVALCTTTLSAQDRRLPPPDKTGGKPLMECFTLRQSTRGFADKPLPPQIMSNLFYAADGINRKDGRKTVPTARNVQNLHIYAATADGVWLYQPKHHMLKQLAKTDIRALCGRQAFHKKAPVVLIYAAELSKIGKNAVEQEFYAGNHAGYASQNVYLYAASEGLATVVCGLVDRDALAKALNLPDGCKILLTQPVAYPSR